MSTLCSHGPLFKVGRPPGLASTSLNAFPERFPGRCRTCPSHLFHLSQKSWNFASPPDTLSGMHKIIEIFADRAALHTEILALRQQVAVLKRKRPRPSLRKADRVFWVILSCLWPGWRHALVIVRPETVIGWHRKGFRLFWTWKSRRGKPGRPRGRLQNPLAQNDVRAGEPSRRWEARWNKWKGQA